VVARRARVWVWVERFGRWVGGRRWGLEVAVRKCKYSEYVWYEWRVCTSCAGTESAISMSAGASVPLASGVDSGSAICCAELGDGSAIMVVVRREEFAGAIDASGSLWIAL
jgi:hypothetical protein